MRAATALALTLLLFGCSAKPLATVPYRTTFDAPPLGKEWSTRGGDWMVVDGRLFNDGAHNVPLWLSAALPRDVRVTFTAESRSSGLDIKFEIFGDGEHHESGYIVILSGWDNTKSIIARRDEHGPARDPDTTPQLEREGVADALGAAARYRDRREIVSRARKSVPNTTYRFRCERQGETLRLFIDDELHLDYFDPSPIGGPGHDRFAFNNWASKVYFDDLVIEAL